MVTGHGWAFQQELSWSSLCLITLAEAMLILTIKQKPSSIISAAQFQTCCSKTNMLLACVKLLCAKWHYFCMYNTYYHSILFPFLLIGPEPTTWSTTNCLQIMVCSCAVPSNYDFTTNNILLMHNCVHVLALQIQRKMADHFKLPENNYEKQARWSYDKTIIELGFHKISWFASVSQINYLAEANNYWTARHWQITIFCSTLSNNCLLLTIWKVQGIGLFNQGHPTSQINQKL